MPNLALVLATAAICGPINPRISQHDLKEAHWLIQPNRTLISPARPSTEDLSRTKINSERVLQLLNKHRMLRLHERVQRFTK